MFRLSPIKLWRNISVMIFLIAIIFVLIGTFTIRSDLAVQWDRGGVPSNFSGIWVLWVMLLLAFWAMFTHDSFSKKRLGQIPLSREMSGACSSGLVAVWTIVIIVLVTYHFWPTTAIPAIGTIAIVLCYSLFVVIAYVRDRKNVKF